MVAESRNHISESFSPKKIRISHGTMDHAITTLMWDVEVDEVKKNRLKKQFTQSTFIFNIER